MDEESEHEVCAYCGDEFDPTYSLRMEAEQPRHREEQLHLWPCTLLDQRYELTGCVLELYDSPFDGHGEERAFCSDDCMTAYTASGDFQYLWCDSCSRQICERSPSNGWHVQFRWDEDGAVCLSCYEERIIEDGQPESDFEGSCIRGGMFFSEGNHEPKSRGFEEVEGFVSFYVMRPVDAERYNSRARELIAQGARVLTAYERLAIGGLEGFVTMMAKPEQREEGD